MLLASPTDIREALGFEDMVDINDAIRAALKASTAVLSARLGSSFDEGTYTDLFYVNEPGYRQGASVQTEFRLRQGFVRELTGAGFSDSMTALGLRPHPIIDYLIMDQKDRQIGRVRDYTSPYMRSYVTITYTAGFPVSEEDPQMFDLDVVPDWLQEAAKLRAQILMAGSPSLKEADITIDTKTLAAEYGAIVSSNLRYTPVAISPR